MLNIYLEYEYKTMVRTNTKMLTILNRSKNGSCAAAKILNRTKIAPWAAAEDLEEGQKINQDLYFNPDLQHGENKKNMEYPVKTLFECKLSF